MNNIYPIKAAGAAAGAGTKIDKPTGRPLLEMTAEVLAMKSVKHGYYVKIPLAWFQKIFIKTKSGFKPDTIAIILLARIYHWYTPRAVEDEKDPEIKRYYRRFNGPYFFQSEKFLSYKSGFSASQVKRALTRLKKKGYIRSLVDKKRMPNGEIKFYPYLIINPQLMRALNKDDTCSFADQDGSDDSELDEFEDYAP